MPLKKCDLSRMVRISKAVKDELVPIMADVVRTDTDPYVPDVTGSLAGSAYANEADIREGRIVYGRTLNSESGTPVSNYASAQHDGLPNKTKQAHPKATMEWTEASKAANESRWQRIADAQAKAIARRTK